MRQRFWVKGTGEGQNLEYEEKGHLALVRIGDREVPVDISLKPGSPYMHLLIEGRSYPCTFHEEENIMVLNLRGREYRFEVLSDRRKRVRDLGLKEEKAVGSKDIVAPIPGLVVEVEVNEGDTVEAGQGVVIMEAMKMENELKAPAAGIVKAIKTEKGTPVDQGQLLIEIE
jgi:pyruvate carboxylase subunit B